MLSVPPALTAYQGFDALFHSTEGYIANIATPLSDVYALKSIGLIFRSLADAVADGSNLAARTDVALANTLSGFVESTSSCTSEHSLEHAMSAFHPKLPHGAGLLMLSDAYYTHFAAKAPARFADMAAAAGADLGGVPEDARAAVFVSALKKLRVRCGVDELRMSEYGIARHELPAFARNARETMGGLFGFDPAPLTDAEVLSIYEKSYR